MSSTSGLSSNTSNNQPRNSLQLDASTRDSILAQNQARIMSALGMSKKDQFTSGGVGGLNPLKGLYSAAAATFLKNKQSQQSEESSRGLGSYEKAADILKSLAAKKEASSDPGASFQNTNAKVSGPASSTNYKKYQWDGNPGPTGSDVVYEEDEAEEVSPADEGGEPADFQNVHTALESIVTGGGGNINDNGDGTKEFSVLDLKGTIVENGDHLVGKAEGGSGTYTFTITAAGAVKIDATEGDVSSVEFDQLKRMLSGNLEGASRVAEAEAATEPAASSTTEPASTGSGSTSSTTEPASTGSGSTSSTTVPQAPTALQDTFSDIISFKGAMSQAQGADAISRLDKYIAASNAAGVAVDKKRIADVVNVLAKSGPSYKVMDKADDYATKFNKGETVKLNDMMSDLKKALSDGASDLVVGSILTSSTMSLALASASGKEQDLGRYNAKLLFNDIQAAGGAVALASDGQSFLISLNGKTGTMKIESGSLKGKLGSGDGEISFEIKQNGDTKIDGKGSNSTAQANSLAFRTAIGGPTTAGTKFDARMVKFNRYGTGTGLNLLG